MNKNSIKIDRQNKVVYMTEKQFNNGKSKLVCDNGFYKTKKGYDVKVGVVINGKYVMTYSLLMEILLNSIKGLQVMSYNSHKDRNKSMTARIYHICQLLESVVPDSESKAKNQLEAMADSEGFSILKEIMAMPDAEREALIESERMAAKMDSPVSPTMNIMGEEMRPLYLSHLLHIGCSFMCFDLATVPLGYNVDKALCKKIISGKFIIGILEYHSEEESIEYASTNFGGDELYVYSCVCTEVMM